MKKRTLYKLAVSALAAAGAGALLFNLTTEAMAGFKMAQVEAVPTDYQVSGAENPEEEVETEKAVERTLDLPVESMREDSEAKSADSHTYMPSYTVLKDTENMNAGAGEPTAADLTMEDAAAYGAGYLQQIFDLDTEGAYFYMSYNKGTITFPRPFWSGDVLFTDEKRTPESDRWFFMLDAVTGELFNISHSDILDVEVSLGYDVSLEQNHDVYKKLAGEYAKKIDIMGSPVAEITYEGQGYGGNNPDITMKVIGENGSSGYLTFSRYDQKFQGLITAASDRISKKALADLMNEPPHSEYTEIETVDLRA